MTSNIDLNVKFLSRKTENVHKMYFNKLFYLQFRKYIFFTLCIVIEKSDLGANLSWFVLVNHLNQFMNQPEWFIRESVWICMILLESQITENKMEKLWKALFWKYGNAVDCDWNVVAVMPVNIFYLHNRDKIHQSFNLDPWHWFTVNKHWNNKIFIHAHLFIDLISSHNYITDNWKLYK